MIVVIASQERLAVFVVPGFGRAKMRALKNRARIPVFGDAGKLRAAFENGDVRAR